VQDLYSSSSAAPVKVEPATTPPWAIGGECDQSTLEPVADSQADEGVTVSGAVACAAHQLGDVRRDDRFGEEDSGDDVHPDERQQGDETQLSPALH
jgi:hypothetical protein